MRALILACLAASLVLACAPASTDNASGKSAPAQANLSITTTGNGLVRGAGTDCRGNCRAQVAVGSPVHLADAPVTVRIPPAALGRHTDDVLAELGLAPLKAAS